jgi:hypothetical protein
MSARDRVRARLEAVCLELGKPLLEHLTLVGGSTQAVLPLLVDVRPTKDIDLIFAPEGALGWHKLTRRLEDRGFRASEDEDAPACRYVKTTPAGRLVIDVMPTDDRLGFTNPWYEEAHQRRQHTDIEGLFAVTPLLYLLTKIEAYKSRGAADPLSSHDLEDIVAICRGLPGFLDELQVMTDAASSAARSFLSEFASNPFAEAWIAAHIEGDAHGASAVDLHQRLRRFS